MTTSRADGGRTSDVTTEDAVPHGGSPVQREYATIRGYVDDAIRRVYRAWGTESTPRGIADPRVRAALARLRRAGASQPGVSPEIWEYWPGDPATSIRNTSGSTASAGHATPQEIAAHHALTLWALHQQSKADFMHDVRRTGDGSPMSCSFAEAVQKLSKRRDGDREPGNLGPVRRRFVTVARAQSIDAMVTHARGLIQQLRDEGIAFDYGRFAEDLLRFQLPGERSRVQRQWSREFQPLSSSDLDPHPDSPDHDAQEA